MVLKRILFCFLMAFLGFCAGMAVGSLFVPAGSGLAGPAIALGYGLAGLVVGLILAIILFRNLKSGFRVVFIIVVILSLGMCGWIVYRFMVIGNKQSTQQNFPGIEKNHQHTNAQQANYTVYKETGNKMALGSGMAKLHLDHNRIIYFYYFSDVDTDPSTMRPVDSIVIIKRENHFEISYAPPWFFPEHLKLDYDILFLRVLTISRNWMEVVVNKQTEQTHWIALADADFIEWQTFLLHVFAVELIDPHTNPVRVKPLDYAGILATVPLRFSLSPLAVRGDWMMVSTPGLANPGALKGWIRWRKDEKLLVRYSLLS